MTWGQCGTKYCIYPLVYSVCSGLLSFSYCRYIVNSHKSGMLVERIISASIASQKTYLPLCYVHDKDLISFVLVWYGIEFFFSVYKLCHNEFVLRLFSDSLFQLLWKRRRTRITSFNYISGMREWKNLLLSFV